MDPSSDGYPPPRSEDRKEKRFESVLRRYWVVLTTIAVSELTIWVRNWQLGQITRSPPV